MRVSARVSFATTFLFALAAGPLLHAQDSVKVERPTSDLITREQIAGLKSSNLFEVVETLHSNWLRERMPSPSDRATTRQDYSVRRIDAQARFGIGHGAGVLFISSVTMRSQSPN